MRHLVYVLSVVCMLLPSSKISAALVKNEIKVLTLNTWMIPVLRKMAKARAEAIGRELGNYDISLMQEAFTPGVRKTMATLAKEHDFHNRYQKSTFLKINSGMYTFTRFEITKTDFMRFYNCGGPQCLSTKGILYTQIKLPSGELVDLFNTHLQAYEDDHRVRRFQMKNAMKFVNKINDGSLPVIFAGDFNVIGETPEYDTLMKELGNFTDVWRVLRPNDPGFTWDPSINNWARYDFKESHLLQRLDYIFIRDGEDTKISVKEVSLAFDEQKMWYGVYFRPNYIFVSDHFGVEATLVIEKK